MKKRILSLVLSVLMLVSLLPTMALAATTYNDTQDHWAEDAIDRWSEYGVVSGKGGDAFDPNGPMKRSEAAQMFANLLGLNKEGDISEFTDVKNDWYTSAIAKCYAAGIMSGKGNGKMDPNGLITREEFFTMFARAVCISNGGNAADVKSGLSDKGYTDTAKVSDWAADAIGTLVDKGYVSGVSDNEIAPKANINRASVMSLLDQSISTYAGKDSTETTVAAKSEGITLIANPAVTTVTGTADVVVVAAGAEQYDAATGEIAHNDIRVESAKMPVARVQGENITVTLAVNTEAEDAEVTETAVKSEIVVDSTAKVNKLTVSAEGAKATVAGKVETVKVEETAKNATIDTKSTAKVETVENKAENTVVTGTGSVGSVKSSEDVKVETKNTKVENTSETKEIAVTDSKGTETKVETKTEGTATTKPETTVNTQPTGGGGGGHSHNFGENGTTKCSCGAFAANIVAAIGDQGYETLAAAVAAADGETATTISLVKDITLTDTVTMDKANVTLKGNGKTVTVPKTVAVGAMANSAFMVAADDVTFDGVKIVLESAEDGTNYHGTAVNVNKSRFTFKDGEIVGAYDAKFTATNGFNTCVAILLQQSENTATITGNTIVGCEYPIQVTAYSGPVVFSNNKVEHSIFFSCVCSDVTIENVTQSENATADEGEKEVRIVLNGGGVDDSFAYTLCQTGLPVYKTTDFGKYDSNNYTSYAAVIGGTKNKAYDTLQSAVSAAEAGDTITLLRDCSGDGIQVKKSLTFDFNGHSYTAVANPTGSQGTKNQVFQLLNESGSVTFKNGAIYGNNSGIKLLIQNYCDLTLQNMTLDATKGSNNVTYVLSNNCGTVNITGNTSITAKDGGYAFDAYYWPTGSDAYKAGVTVKVNTTGTIKGNIELDADGVYVTYKNTVNISNGNFVGSFNVAKGNLSITGGTFSSNPSDYVSFPCVAEKVGDVWTVTEKVYVFRELKNIDETAGTAAVVWEEAGNTSSTTETTNHPLYVVTKGTNDGTYDKLNVSYQGQPFKTNTSLQGIFAKNALPSGAVVLLKGDTYTLNEGIIDFYGDVIFTGEAGKETETVLRVCENGGSGYKIFRLYNRYKGSPLSHYAFANMTIQSINDTDNNDNAFFATCYNIQCDLKNVTFKNYVGYCVGAWANDTYDDNITYPTKADNLGVDYYLDNVSFENCGTAFYFDTAPYTATYLDRYGFIHVTYDTDTDVTTVKNLYRYAASSDDTAGNWMINGEVYNKTGKATN